MAVTLTYTFNLTHIFVCDKLPTGYLGGSEDYYSHTVCMGPLYGCGLDLCDQVEPVFDENGTYSAYPFTKRAVNVINNHDKSKVMLCDPASNNGFVCCHAHAENTHMHFTSMV